MGEAVLRFKRAKVKDPTIQIRLSFVSVSLQKWLPRRDRTVAHHRTIIMSSFVSNWNSQSIRSRHRHHRYWWYCDYICRVKGWRGIGNERDRCWRGEIRMLVYAHGMKRSHRRRSFENQSNNANAEISRFRERPEKERKREIRDRDRDRER